LRADPGFFVVTDYGFAGHNSCNPPTACDDVSGGNYKLLNITLNSGRTIGTSEVLRMASAATYVKVYYVYPALGTCPAGATAELTFNPSTGALPIDLVDFKAKNNDKTISLNWRTAEEKNVNFFAVERSKNGRDFKEVAQVKTGELSKEYHYTDEKPFYGTSYYRLKMAENDGSAVNYSKTVSVNMSTKGAVKITPSLASDRITVDLPENLGEMMLNVLDISGRVISSTISSALQENIDVSNLAQGMYILRVESGRDVFTERFVKQ
jgi:hypothetical protein